MEKLAFTSEELCEATGLNKNNLKLYREMGLLKYIKVGNKYLYPRDKVIEFLDKCIGMDISDKYSILATKGDK